MKAKIKSITLKFFKGIKDLTLKLNDNCTISGENGVGKTTIATAYYWVFGNTDYDLKSNPDIFPIGVEECTPTVTVDMEIDGKPVRVTKSQVRKYGKPDENGISKVTYANSYSVNEVPLSERDFKAKLETYGFNFNDFQALSHINVFASEKKDEQRKILFSMASEISDIDVAKRLGNVGEASKLLENYSIDEIQAMQKATIRKIAVDYGKDGEILNSKIEGLEMAKNEVDVKAVEGEIKGYEVMLEDKELEILETQTKKAEYLSALDDVMDLKFELSNMANKAYSDWKSGREKAESDVNASLNTIRSLEYDIKRYQNFADLDKNSIEKRNSAIEGLKAKIEDIKGKELPEDATICPTCKRKLTESKIEEARKNWEERKVLAVEKLSKELEAEVGALENEKLNARENASNLLQAKDKLEKENVNLKALKEALDLLPSEPVDVKATDDYKHIENLIAEKEATASKSDECDRLLSTLKLDELNIRDNLNNAKRKLSLVEQNARIDKQIADLREQQIDFEQNKANAEKVLYQLDLIAKAKNELITDEINKHFSLVKFSFFEYYKNGDYKECCNFSIDDKKFGSATNTGREILAKLDIIAGLQAFYNESYPVFVDGYEALSSTSLERITTNCQLIGLKVTENNSMEVK